MLPKKSTRIRKEEIVQAALEVIGKNGVRSLTIAAIAAAAGMSEANLYRHFGGKDEIFSALVDYIGSAVMGKAATIAAGSRGPLEKLEAIFRSHMSLIAEQPGIPRLVFSEDVHFGNRKLAEIIAFRMGSYIETLAGVIAAGIREGELRQDLSPRETAITLLGLMPITVLRCNLTGTSFDIKQEADRLWDNFLRLIR
ncbi:MAG: TetR/AcrR family transcriptional regulator [Geobacteraceae bacterium]